MSIVFWQPIPSFHQSAFIRALGERVEVSLVVQDELPRSFAANGWACPDFAPARVVVGHESAPAARLIARANERAVHIFSGFGSAAIRGAFVRTAATGATVGWMSEAADGRGFAGLARRFRYGARAVRYRSRLSFVLAMGRQGVEWYSSCGIPAQKLFPFAYVAEGRAEPDLADALSPRRAQAPVRLLYTGQCIKRKGVDVLLEALSRLRTPPWRLDVVGDGPEREGLRRLSTRAGLADRVVFHGALPNESARALLSAVDVCVLPSRWDGWGVVVNEALMAGVPVICTDRCGASELLGAERGEVVTAASADRLREALARWIAKGKRTPEASLGIRSWAARIEGHAVAEYLLKVLACAAGDAPRPVPPWQ